jgi:hypothetical protein
MIVRMWRCFCCLLAAPGSAAAAHCRAPCFCVWRRAGSVHLHLPPRPARHPQPAPCGPRGARRRRAPVGGTGGSDKGVPRRANSFRTIGTFRGSPSLRLSSGVRRAVNVCAVSPRTPRVTLVPWNRPHAPLCVTPTRVLSLFHLSFLHAPCADHAPLSKAPPSPARALEMLPASRTRCQARLFSMSCVSP